jgi:hypothetical protein
MVSSCPQPSLEGAGEAAFYCSAITGSNSKQWLLAKCYRKKIAPPEQQVFWRADKTVLIARFHCGSRDGRFAHIGLGTKTITSSHGCQSVRSIGLSPNAPEGERLAKSVLSKEVFGST